MILNIAYAELLPRAKELAELIAHELQVDINQVRLKFSFLYFGKSLTFWDLQIRHCRDYEVKVLMFGSSGRNSSRYSLQDVIVGLSLLCHRSARYYSIYFIISILFNIGSYLFTG